MFIVLMFFLLMVFLASPRVFCSRDFGGFTLFCWYSKFFLLCGLTDHVRFFWG